MFDSFRPTGSKSTDKLRVLAAELMPKLQPVIDGQAHRLKSIKLDWIEQNSSAGPTPTLNIEFFE